MRMKRLAVVVIALALAGCTKPGKTREVLEQQGYKQVEVTGFRPLSCGEDDVFKTGFAATSPSGAQVTGVVCSGWFKGNTVRLD